MKDGLKDGFRDGSRDGSRMVLRMVLRMVKSIEMDGRIRAGGFGRTRAGGNRLGGVAESR